MHACRGHASRANDYRVDCTWDHGNRWVRKIFDPGGQDEKKTIFVYDGNQIALRFHDEGSGDLGADDLTNRYCWGPAVDQILADEQVHWDDTPGQEGYVTDELLWPLGDHLGSVRDVIDSSGTVKIHRVYDAFGNFTENPSTASHLFAFTARRFDAATGLQNNLNRWYDPPTGCWLSEDPLVYKGKDFNLYRYVHNRPTVSTDPSGLYIVCWARMNANIACNCAKACDYVNPFRIPGAAGRCQAAGWEAANRLEPGGGPRHEALRHCITLACLARELDGNCAACIGRVREEYQEACQGQSPRSTQRALRNNAAGYLICSWKGDNPEACCLDMLNKGDLDSGP